MQLIDTHCHVHFDAYDADRREVILRARDRGVGMVLIGTMLSTSKSAIEVANWFGDSLWATVGLHPTDVEDGMGDMHAIAELASHPKVVGIGETGLDYFHAPQKLEVKAYRKLQHDSLRAHIALADRVGKTLIIHCRDAHDDLMKIMDEEIAAGRFVKRGILHCFTGTAEQAAAYVARGCAISFAGVITFPAKKTAPEQQESLWRAVRETPLESMLVETDAPFLTPDPHRGKRNEPAFVKFTAEKVAELKGVSFEKVATTTTENARRIFGIA